MTERMHWRRRPNLVTAGWPLVYLAAQGKIDEALDLTLEAMERDPLSHGSELSVAWLRYLARDYEGAIRQSEHALEMAPDSQELLQLLAHSRVETGDSQGTVDAYERWARAGGYSEQDVSTLRARFATEGLPGLWRFLLSLEERDEEETGATWPYRRAALHARLAEADAAFRWLDAAF